MSKAIKKSSFLVRGFCCKPPIRIKNPHGYEADSITRLFRNGTEKSVVTLEPHNDTHTKEIQVIQKDEHPITFLVTFSHISTIGRIEGICYPQISKVFKVNQGKVEEFEPK